LGNRADDHTLGETMKVASLVPFALLLGATMGAVNAFTGLASGGMPSEALSAGLLEALVVAGVGTIAVVLLARLYSRFAAAFDRGRDDHR
jgi:hypothetical protein